MLLILGHLLVARFQLLAEHVWSAKGLNEGADPPAANDVVEPLVNCSSSVMVNFFCMRHLLYV
jgi:hypothetical protein